MRMANPISSDILMIIGEAMLGRICRPRMRGVPAPSARAAITKVSAFFAITSPRTSRAKPGHHDSAMAKTVLPSPGPIAAATAIARISDGKVSIRSVKRINASSSQPP